MEAINLDLLPGAMPPIVHVSQGDVGRQFKIAIYDDTGAAYSLTGKTLSIVGHKGDGNVFQYAIPSSAISGNEVTITTEEQMTPAAGKALCEIRIEQNGTKLGTANFVMDVEQGPADMGSLSISALYLIDALIQEATADVEASAASAAAAANSATAAANSATSASGYATNASTSATNAASSATAAANSATAAYNSANGADTAKSGCIIARNDCQASEERASHYADAASSSATAAANSATAAAASESKIANMTVSSQSVPYTQSADVVKTEVGGVYNLDFKIPRGAPTSGHDVEANPSGDATGDLTKLGIDGTIYNVAGGSGSADILPTFLDASSVKSGATFSSVVDWLTGGSGQANSDFIWIYYYNSANADKFPFLRTQSGQPTKELDVDIESLQAIGPWSNISEKVNVATSKIPCNILYKVYNTYSTYPNIEDIEYYGSNAILYYDSNYSQYPAIIVYGKTTRSGITGANLKDFIWHVSSVRAAKGCWKEI